MRIIVCKDNNSLLWQVTEKTHSSTTLLIDLNRFPAFPSPSRVGLIFLLKRKKERSSELWENNLRISELTTHKETCPQGAFTAHKMMSTSAKSYPF